MGGPETYATGGVHQTIRRVRVLEASGYQTSLFCPFPVQVLPGEDPARLHHILGHLCVRNRGEHLELAPGIKLTALRGLHFLGKA